MRTDLIPKYKGVDMTGVRFGNWTPTGVIAFRKTGDNYKYLWQCVCDCGTLLNIDSRNLIKRKTTGCRNCYSSRHTKSNNQNWRGFKELSGSKWNSIINGAKVRNIEFSLTKEECYSIFTGKCALSGVPISLEETASLDRIDSKQGYTLDNIQWVHKTINKMKNDLDQNIFISFCKDIATFNS